MSLVSTHLQVHELHSRCTIYEVCKHRLNVLLINTLLILAYSVSKSEKRLIGISHCIHHRSSANCSTSLTKMSTNSVWRITQLLLMTAGKLDDSSHTPSKLKMSTMLNHNELLDTKFTLDLQPMVSVNLQNLTIIITPHIADVEAWNMQCGHPLCIH